MGDITYRGNMNKEMRLIDMEDGTWAERVEAHPPLKLLTDDNSDYARLRVDVAQTSFFSGKEFRTFQKFKILSGETVTIRAKVGCDIILFDTTIGTEDSTIEMQLKVDGSESGPWTAMPVIRKNTISTAPVITSQVSLDYDGGHTGGTLIDLVRISANNKWSAFGGVSSERGVGAGTYYYTLNNVGNQTATVVFSGYWEERV